MRKTDLAVVQYKNIARSGDPVILMPTLQDVSHLRELGDSTKLVDSFKEWDRTRVTRHTLTDIVHDELPPDRLADIVTQLVNCTAY